MEIKAAYNTAVTEATNERRAPWNDHEISLVATAFIDERKTDPFSGSLDILRAAQRKALPEHRQKDIPTWTPVAALRAKLGDAWLDEMTKHAPEPVIVHVETQAPADYVDILHRCDLPSLTALVVAKVSEQLATLKPLITVLNGANAPVGASHQAPVSLLAAASSKPRKSRVLIVGPHARQFTEIENRIRELGLPVDLLLLDRDKGAPTGPIQCDHVIATFVNKILNDALRTNVPAGKYHLLEGSGGLTQFVNKLRDIGTLLPPRA